MPKKRQTRQHKIQSEQRQTEAQPVETNETSVSSPTYSLSQTNVKITTPKSHAPVTKQATTILTSHYHYLAGDLRKTVLLMLAIAAAELSLFYFIKGV